MVKPGTSPSRERREQARRATREKILDAAREMFLEAGVEATTMRAVANRVGYTATAIYYHFQDKHSLLLELCRRDFQELARVLGEAGHIEDPIERIRHTSLACLDFGLSNPSQYRFMFMMAEHVSPDGKSGSNPEAHAYSFFQQCVNDAIAQQRLRPELCSQPGHVANLLWSCVHGVVSLHLVKAQDRYVTWGDPRELGEMVIDSVIRGITVH